jgi:hypothetical protein
MRLLRSLGFLLIAAPALAQTPTTRSALDTQITTTVYACGNGCITGASLQLLLRNMNASYGTLQDNNAFAGVMTFNGAASFTIAPTLPTLSLGTNTNQLATTAFVLAN